MREYALVMLSMLEYEYLNKQSSKRARILNASDAVHIIRSLFKVLSNFQDKSVFRTLLNI